MTRWLLLLFAAIGAGAVAGYRIASAWGSEVDGVERSLSEPVGWQR